MSYAASNRKYHDPMATSQTPHRQRPLHYWPTIIEQPTNEWLYTIDELQWSPSVQDGIPYKDELNNYSKCLDAIIKACSSLKLHRSNIFFAIVYLQRFYQRLSMKPFPYLRMAQACLYLATKKLEHHRGSKAFALTFARMTSKRPDLIDENHPEYWSWRETLSSNEEMLLETLCFDTSLKNPYEYFNSFPDNNKDKTFAEIRSDAINRVEILTGSQIFLLFDIEKILVALLVLCAMKKNVIFPKDYLIFQINPQDILEIKNTIQLLVKNFPKMLNQIQDVLDLKITLEDIEAFANGSNDQYFGILNKSLAPQLLESEHNELGSPSRTPLHNDFEGNEAQNKLADPKPESQEVIEEPIKEGQSNETRSKRDANLESDSENVKLEAKQTNDDENKTDDLAGDDNVNTESNKKTEGTLLDTKVGTAQNKIKNEIKDSDVPTKVPNDVGSHPEKESSNDSSIAKLSIDLPKSKSSSVFMAKKPKPLQKPKPQTLQISQHTTNDLVSPTIPEKRVFESLELERSLSSNEALERNLSKKRKPTNKSLSPQGLKLLNSKEQPATSTSQEPTTSKTVSKTPTQSKNSLVMKVPTTHKQKISPRSTTNIEAQHKTNPVFGSKGSPEKSKVEKKAQQTEKPKRSLIHEPVSVHPQEAARIVAESNRNSSLRSTADAPTNKSSVFKNNWRRFGPGSREKRYNSLMEIIDSDLSDIE